MLAKYTTMTGVLATLQVASAFRDTYTTDEAIQGRVNLGTMDKPELCYPKGNWTLGDNTVTIPPCIAEQMVSRECESRTRAFADRTEDAWNNYRDCLTKDPSSYRREVFGCLKCKLDNKLQSPGEDTFWTNGYNLAFTRFAQANPLQDGFWEFVRRSVDFGNYPGDSKGTRTREVGLDEYYPDPPKTQNVGPTSWQATAVSPRTKRATAGEDKVLDVNLLYHDGIIVNMAATWQ